MRLIQPILLVVLAVLLAGPMLTAQGGDERVSALIAEGDRLSEPSVREYDLGLLRYQEADHLAAGSRDARLRAVARQRLSRGYFNTDRREESVTAGREAAELARAAGALDVTATALRNVGGSLIGLARFDEAEAALLESAELSSRYGTTDDVLRTLNNLSVTVLYQGRLGAAVRYGRRAVALLDRATAAGDPITDAMQFSPPFNLGKALADSGDYVNSRPYLERSFEAAERTGNIGGQMHVLFDTGEWYEAQGDLARAERFYRRSIEFTTLHPSNEGAGKGYRGLGRVMFTTGRLAESVAALSEAVRLFDESQAISQLGPALVDLARAKAAAGMPASAANNLERAVEIGRTNNHVLASVLALVERGRQRRQAGRLDAALADFETAIVRAERDRLVPLVPAAWVGRAEVAEARRDLANAAAAYEEAVDALDRIRGRIVSIDLRTSFAAATHDAFAGLTRVLMQLHAAHPNDGYDARAFAALERERSQSLNLAVREAQATGATDGGAESSTESRIAHLQNALFVPDLASARRRVLLASLDDAERDLALTGEARGAQQSDHSTLADLQRALGPGDAVLEYTTGAAFVVTSSAMQTVPLDVPIDLDARIAFFVSALESNTRDASIASGRVLAEQLVSPLLPHLAGRSRVMIVASGALARLPFAALPVPNGLGTFVPLIARYEVAYLPSLTLFERRRATSMNALDRRLLAVADSGSLDAATNRLAPLPASRAEVRFVAALMPSARVMIAGSATEGAVKLAAAGGFAVMHLATHALLDAGVPERSAILLGKSDNDDGLLQTREIYQLPLNGSLVVLSGCRTADGRLSAAEGLHSLARAFLQAGGRTVVGALWDLPDEPAADMMRRFYAGLDGGRSAGVVLRESQLSEAGADPYGNSRSWAAMVMMGDPSVTLAAGPATQVSLVLAAVVALLVAWTAASSLAAARARHMNRH